MLDILDPYGDRLDGPVELRHHSNHSVSLVMRGGVVVENRDDLLAGVSARFRDDGAYGFASRPGHDGRAIEAVLEEAAANARLARRGRGRGEGALPHRAPGVGLFDHRSALPPWTPTQRLELLRAVNGWLTQRFPRLATVDLGLKTLTIEKSLLTGDGARTYSAVPRALLYVNLVLKEGGEIVERGDLFGGFGDLQDHFWDLSGLFEALERLYAQLEEKAAGIRAAAGEHDVILDSRLAGILAHEAVGHTCEADMVLLGSVAGERLGQVVASEAVTLVDHGGRGPDGLGAIAIDVDDEGTPCQDVTLIDRGVLKGFLHSRETALTFGGTPAGNARAFAYYDEPLVRMRNTAIAPGDAHLDDMIASVDRGYYLVQPQNGQADVTSEFMFGVSFGYEIVGGRLGRALKDTTVAGIAFEMLQTVSAVSEGGYWSKGGMCGKKQWIPVGMGGPALRCRIGIGGL